MKSQFKSRFKPYKFDKFNLVRLPEVKIDPEELSSFGIKCEGKSNNEILAELTMSACRSRNITGKEYMDRINSELSLIKELEFTDYYLLVWRVVNKMRSLDAFIDYGRGSVAGSLVCYVLGITNVDPVKNGLFFERFISRTRAKKQVIDGVTFVQGDLAPDVDLNLGSTRDAIVDWLNEIYKGRICKISNYRTLSGPLLIKEVTKTFLGYHETQAKEIADLIEKIAGVNEDIENMPAKNEHFKKWAEENPEAFQIALSLRDLIIGKSSHASGYVISYYDLDGFIPTELNKEKEIVSSYNMKDVANFVLKLDLLGLTTNQIIKDILDVTGLDINSINLENDPVIYDQFQTKNALLPYGLYQISADTAYRATNEIKPKNLMELSDVNAIARPGALAYLDGYVKNKTESPHPKFAQILSKTRNFCLYQEQMMQMAVVVGFTLEEAETLRRIVGKKDIEEAKKWKQKIYDKCDENKFSREIGDILWKILDDSSKYSFNLSHALATASLSALTVYLKYKHPKEFYWACLRHAKDLPDSISHISDIYKELDYFKIKLLPPNLIESDLDFKIVGNDIRFGLSSIKGISDKTIGNLIKFKKLFNNKFAIFQSAEEAGINLSVLGALILSGALDDSRHGTTRPRLVLESQLYSKLTTREKNLINELNLGEKMNYNLIDVIKWLSTNNNEKGKPFISEKRMGTIRKAYIPFQAIYKENTENIEFTTYFFEKTMLGFSYSYNLLDIFKKKVPNLMSIREVLEQPSKAKVKTIGHVVDVYEGTSKKKIKYLRVYIDDGGGKICGMLFNNAFADKIDECLASNGRQIEKGDVVVIRGTKSDDAIFADAIGVQTCKAFRHFNQIEKQKN